MEQKLRGSTIPQGCVNMTTGASISPVIGAVEIFNRAVGMDDIVVYEGVIGVGYGVAAFAVTGPD